MSDIRRFGAGVPNFVPPPRPGPEALEGQRVWLERLDADLHAADLHRAFVAIKWAEYSRMAEHVSQMDLDHYLHRV